jgi:hypothetical protein
VSQSRGAVRNTELLDESESGLVNETILLVSIVLSFVFLVFVKAMKNEEKRGRRERERIDAYFLFSASHLRFSCYQENKPG